LLDLATRALDVVLGLSAGKPEELGVLQVCARAFVVYLVLIAYVRFGKKRFLGEATAFDVILVIMIGSLASRGISGNAPLGATLAAVLLLIAMHWVISYVTEKSPLLSGLTKGHDTMLVKNGRVLHAALRQSHMSIDDLEEDLRQEGVDSVRKVKEARLERSGKVSVIRR
jgi:uncharacterized membrane protein YcaP (DUF421 family)